MKHSFLAMTLAAVAVGVSSIFVASPPASASISSEVVKTGDQDSLYPVVHLKDDAAVEAKINADIRNQIEDMKAALNYHYDELQVSYKLKYEGQSYVSLVLCVWTYTHRAAHGMPHYRGVTYSIYNLSVFSGSGKVIPKYQLFQNYADTPLSGNFYLAGHGQVALIYQPYQLAAFAYGMTSIILPANLLEELNEKNP